MLGTGWHGELPPEEFARFLPDARDRFPDQPPRYFPPADGTFVPQQTYDQVLFQLGLVGAALCSSLLALAVRARSARSAAAGRAGDRPTAAYLPAGLARVARRRARRRRALRRLAAAALFWLTLGVVAAQLASCAAASGERDERSSRSST